MNTDILIACLYIFYGIVKIGVGISVIYLPQSQLEKIPIINKLSKHAYDNTLAGNFYEYILLIFGVYTIIYGLNILEYIPEPYSEIMDQKETEYRVFIILGLALTIFYTLVLYTNLPISKDMKYTSNYKILGLFGGLSFLAMPVIWEMLENGYPFFKQLSMRKKSLFVLGMVILSIILIEFSYNYLYNKSLIENIL